MSTGTQKFKLISGNYMPLIGFGTFQIQGKQLIKEVLDYALAAGYRAIDTAAVYGNEQDIGDALKELLPKYKLKREDIFITSKLSPSDQGSEAVKALENSVRNLQCDYLDLYLIHWPGASGVPTNSPENARLRAASWTSLVGGKERGLSKDIGVSNYTVRHLTELLGSNSGVKPAVNQVEWHPHHHQSELKRYCEREEILLQAYSSLGGTNNKSLITEPTVVAVAQKLKKSPAQVLLRWALQQNIAVIPKARSRKHIQENIELDFEIPVSDMATLSGLKTTDKYAWDPNSVK